MLQQEMMLDNTYKIIEPIGEGGGGVVYRAYHTRLQKDVVVKLIKDNVKGKLDSRGEADILKKLKHTYLPQVLDFIEADGNVYTVMDFIPGRSFAQELKDGKKFSQKQVIKWAGQLCEALEYLHKQKPAIIHSDIKPGNVMLTPDGDVCLIDFNISQLFSDSAAPLGRTDGYAPPEQYGSKERNPAKPVAVTPQVKASGFDSDETQLSTAAMQDIRVGRTEIGYTDIGKTELSTSAAPANANASVPNPTHADKILRMDERSDIYSLGATLYHMLTGQKPNTAIYGVKPLKDCGINISDGLNFIITRAMDSDPKKRFSSATEMLRAVKNIHKLDKTYKRQMRKQEMAAIFLILLFTASALSCIVGLRTMKQEYSDRYYAIISAAMEKLEAGDYEGCAAAASQAVVMFPSRTNAYYALALSMYKAGKYDETIRYLEGIKTKAYEYPLPGDSIVRADMNFILANSYFENQDFTNAVFYYKAAVKDNPANNEYYRDYAIALARLGETGRAKAVLDEAVEKGLGTATVLLVKGEIASHEERFAEAEQAFLQVLETADDSYMRMRAYISCAEIYRSQETMELTQKEVALLGKAAAELPKDLNLLVVEQLGGAYSRLAEQQPSQREAYYRQAADCFAELLDRGYTRLYVMQNLAIIHQNIGEYEQAELMLTRMEEQYPDNYKVYMQRAFLYMDMQQQRPNEQRDYAAAYQSYQQSRKLYSEAAKNNANDPQMMMLEEMIAEIKSGGWLN